MTTGMSDRPTWGEQLRSYRQRSGLTQGQFIEKLSLLVSEIDTEDRLALENIDIFNEASAYFSGVLDSPTLSRLEKGNRDLNSRSRCLALIWGLNRLGVLTESAEANRFMELSGHGNLTDAESTTLLNQANEHTAPSTTIKTTQKTTQETSRSQKRLMAVGTAVAVAALALAAAIGWAIRDARDKTGTDDISATPGYRTHVMLTDDLQSEIGEIGRDQSFASLHEKDQVNDRDDWTHFIKLIPDDKGDYFGYRVFHLPSHIQVDSITSLRLDVNYRGPDYETAPWVWKVERRDNNEWIRLGDNRDSQWWSTWSEASFNFPADDDKFDASLYLRDSQFWILHTGKFAGDTLDLDYEVLVVEWDDSDAD